MKPAEIITEKIIEKLREGVVPWRNGYRKGIARNIISHKAYRGVNFLLLNYMTSYSSDYWMTYKQAKERGGHIKAGEKATPVIFYKNLEEPGIEYAEEDEEEEKKTTRPSKPNRAGFVLRYYSVFNLDQTEGIERPADDCAALNFSPIERAEEIVKEYPAPAPKIEHFGGHVTPGYNKRQDSIIMPPRERFESIDHYYAVLFHEMTHSTGHETRLNRPLEHLSTSTLESYSKEELIAELGACFLCNESGIEKEQELDNQAAYIDHWIKKLTDDPRLIISASAQAQKAIDYILNK